MQKLGFYSILLRKLFLILVILISFNSFAQNTDNNLATVYLDSLRKAYKDNDIDTMKGVLRMGEDFFKKSSDYSFFKGYVAQEELRFEEAINFYRQALTRFTNGANTVKVISPSTLVYELIPVYYRLMHYDEIIYIYNSYPLFFNESTAFYYLLALKNSGSSELASEGERLALVYPSDVKIFAALFNEKNFRSMFLPLLRNISKGYNFNIKNLLERSIIMARLNSIKNKDLQTEVATLYANFLKLDSNYQNFVFANKIAVPPTPTLSIVNTSFFNMFNTDLQTSYLQQAKTEVVSTGQDFNYDGIADRYITMKKDRMAVSYDINQDKKIEYSVVYVNGKINYIENFQNDQIQYYFFEKYPYLSSVAVVPTENPLPSAYPDATIYSINDTTLNFKNFFYEEYEIFNKYDKIPVFTDHVNLPPQDLRLKSFLIDEYVQGIHIRRVHLKKGKIISVINNPEESDEINILETIRRDTKTDPSEFK